mmetsp:Transcript_13046/g.39534  ORF Transcript_13046/g.39534 Transcript_13046/m.39534 type:complete len:557 (-) Transcript_13046:602-2272(-)
MALILDKEIPLRAKEQTDVSFAEGDPLLWSGDLLVYGLHTEAVAGSGQDLSALNDAVGGIVRDFVDLEGFKGSLGTTKITRRCNGGTRLIAVVGLGPTEVVVSQGAAPGPSPYRVLGEKASVLAGEHGAKTAAVALLSAADTTIDESAPRRHDHVHDLEHRGADIALGLLVGGYKCSRFKSADAPSPLQSATIFSLGAGPDMADEATRASHLARGVTFCRYLAEAPANLCTPEYLARVAQSIAEAAPQVMTLEVLDVAACTALGMGCYLAVGAASAHIPHFIHLTYKPESGRVAKKLALVGKSITFDTGGYNLKVHGFIEKMKADMAGGAAVLGAAEALSHIRPDGLEVHFILPAAENAVSGSGMRPSDIVTASNGKTIEIEDTDAEGRLVLADALVFAEKLGVDAIVDIATLTGAAYVALGPSVGALFTECNQMAGALRAAAQTSGESIWQLPMESRYRKLLDSPIADLKNYAGQPAGAITAALFLREFVSPAVQWGHIDAAALAYDAETKLYTGWGVLTLTHWVLSQGSAHKVAVFGFKDIPHSPAKDTGTRGK